MHSFINSGNKSKQYMADTNLKVMKLIPGSYTSTGTQCAVPTPVVQGNYEVDSL